MRAGRMNKLVQLQLRMPDGTTDDWGTPIEPWADQFEAYAAIEPTSWKTMAGAAETILSGVQTTYDLVTIEIHPSQALLTGTWRVLYGELIYDVRTTRVNNKGDRMILIATVGASHG